MCFFRNTLEHISEGLWVLNQCEVTTRGLIRQTTQRLHVQDTVLDHPGMDLERVELGDGYFERLSVCVQPMHTQGVLASLR